MTHIEKEPVSGWTETYIGLGPVSYSEVDYLNANGAGTVMGDGGEKAIESILQKALIRI